ncbi:MAG: hypothetical protein O3C10_04105 [Chloroflexi bacterium]|nr:hypothetical protein [Chloroflexota bacterium]
MVSVVSLSSVPLGGEVPVWSAEASEAVRTELVGFGSKIDALIAPLGRVESRRDQRVLLDSLLEPFKSLLANFAEVIVGSPDVMAIITETTSTDYLARLQELARDKLDLLGRRDLARLDGALESFAGLQEYAGKILKDLLGGSLDLQLRRLFELERLNHSSRPIERSMLLLRLIDVVLADRSSEWNLKSLHLAIATFDDLMIEVEDEFLTESAGEEVHEPTAPADEVLARLGV